MSVTSILRSFMSLYCTHAKPSRSTPIENVDGARPQSAGPSSSKSCVCGKYFHSCAVFDSTKIPSSSGTSRSGHGHFSSTTPVVLVCSVVAVLVLVLVLVASVVVDVDGSPVVLVLVGGAAVVGVSLSVSLAPSLPSLLGPPLSLSLAAVLVLVSPCPVTLVMPVPADESAVVSPALPLQAGSSAAANKT
ncbi:hypothetical protein [Nannocystis pusilla]|uniref:hypothetical protein n=1 Tax=Nannocystis pusilla TaxID=889268 RepID=UPI003B7C44E1